MKNLIEIIKEDPGEAVGALVCWCGLFAFVFAGFVIL